MLSKFKPKIAVNNNNNNSSFCSGLSHAKIKIYSKHKHKYKRKQFDQIYTKKIQPSQEWYSYKKYQETDT
jgi:hypothetical protein